MYCKEKNLVVRTDAGTFNDCMCVVWEFDEKLAGNSYCETYFAPGVGIVKQFVIGRDGAHTWELKDYSITGGVGILPFANAMLFATIREAISRGKLYDGNYDDDSNGVNQPPCPMVLVIG